MQTRVPEPDGPNLADFADTVLELAAKLDPRSPDAREILPLTGTEVAVIRQVHRRPRITPSRLAEDTGLKRSNISTAVRALEGRGMVVREHPNGDGRSVELVATELAEANLDRLHDYWAQRLRQADPALLAEAVAAAEVLRRLAGAIR
ncbi:MarR family transcriptional regulator [Gordonia sp. ABSL1-1]|uniref:MarR family transcriptional regulator n=1 Tax=Gordonia sp. ABSL1-1 TaxID=3053923 RepID=UPI00257486D5|nr:MarR family transcriptional regulator [Gordonia sp. ABSL1-1]MDL9937709.1 MarR family transcriptional regulator [Gordonia sp. ABSL1-1]